MVLSALYNYYTVLLTHHLYIAVYYNQHILHATTKSSLYNFYNTNLKITNHYSKHFIVALMLNVQI